MMAGSHVALGVAAWLVAAPRLGLSAASPVCLGLALVGSLMPDIDHPNSWLGKRLRPLSSGAAAVLGHRGVTHSALALAACTWGLLHGGAPRWVVAPLATGYLSHLAADLLTPGGLRLAWPLRRTWALPLCKTGSPFEPLIVALLLFWAGSGTLVPPLLREVWGLSGLTRPAPLTVNAAHNTNRAALRPATQAHRAVPGPSGAPTAHSTPRPFAPSPL